jgi:AcrR family transcriptional regulator
MTTYSSFFATLFFHVRIWFGTLGTEIVFLVPVFEKKVDVMEKQEKDLKQRIILHVRDILKNSGYRTIRTDEIASDLGISKRTLYKEIGSKSNMIKEVLSFQMNKVYTNIRQKTELLRSASMKEIQQHNQSVIDTIVETNTFFDQAMMQDIKKNIPEIFEDFDQSFHDKIISAVGELLQVTKEKGMVREEIDNLLFFHIVHSTMSHLLEKGIYKEIGLSIEETIKQTMSILVRGIVTPTQNDNILREGLGI